MSVPGGLRLFVLSLCVAVLAAAPAAAAPAVSGEFPVSGLDSNNKIAQGPDGNMWVTLTSASADVARIAPGGEVAEYDLGVAGPSGIAAGPEGRLWITRDNGVTSFAPADPVGSEVSTTIPSISNPSSIVLGPEGSLWVATYGDLVRFPPADPATSEDFPFAGLDPRDIDVAGSLLAVADFGGGRIFTATPSDPAAITEYKLTGGSQGVAGAANGQIAFSQQGAAPQIGLLSPPGQAQLTASPGPDPFGVALGPDGAFWIAQHATSTLTRLGPDNQPTTLTGFAAGSGPTQLASGPGNTLWVTLDGTEKIGRVSGVEPPAVPIAAPAARKAPRTFINRAPNAMVATTKKWAVVQFRFGSPDRGATFQCRMRRLPNKNVAKASKLAKPLKFRGCRSPKSYRLEPGRYRFEVRALLAGVPDRTPARRGFRVVRANR